MSSTANGNLTATTGSNSASISITTNGTTTRIAIIAIPITLSVKIPAHTVYTVKMTYGFQMAGKNGRIEGISNNWWENANADYMIKIASNDPNSDVSGLKFNINDQLKNINFGTHYSSNGVSMYNNTDSETTVSVYNYYYYFASDGNSGNTYTGSMTFNSCTVESVASIGATTADGDTEVTYDGQPKTFKFTFESPTISTYNTVNYTTAFKNIDTTIEAVDLYNNTINANDYTLDATTANGTLIATKAGTYTVKFQLKQSAVDADIRWSGGGAGEKTIEFKINPVKVTVPVAPNAKEYTGSAQTVALTYFDDAKIKTDSVTAAIPANTATVTDSDGNAWTDTTGSFKITNVDTYTFTLKLRDEDNYVWNEEPVGNGERKVIFDITQKELGLSYTSSSLKSGKAVWEAGETATITVTDGRISTDNLSLLFYYDEISNVLTGTPNGNATEITMPTNISVGKHKLYVELNGSTGDNANYKITKNNAYDFEVSSATASTDFDWTYSENNTEKGEITDGGELKYKLNTEYSVAVVIPEDQRDYINITGYTNDKGSVVGAVKTTVTLESTDPTKLFDDGNGNKSSTVTLTFNWKIVKGDYDMSGVEWEYEYVDENGQKKTGKYTGALEYNDGRNITVKVNESTLPTGFTLLTPYTDRQSGVDTYTTTIPDSYYEYDSDNFNAPAELTLNWEIKKKNLGSQWTIDRQTSDGGSTFFAQILKTSSAMQNYIVYKYYDMSNGGAEVTMAEIKAAATPTEVKTYKVVATIDPDFTDRYEVNGGGAEPFKTFTTGSNNKIAIPTVDGKTEDITAVYDGNGHFGASSLKVTSEDGQILADYDYSVVYYKDSVADGNELTGEPVNAGTYIIVFTLSDDAAEDYVIDGEWVTVKILPKAIAVPTLSEIVFKNDFINIADYLGGSYTDYKDIAQIILGGTRDGVKNVGTYTATLTITNGNYCWDYGTSATPAKKLAKYALADDSVNWTGDETVANLEWSIKPYVLKASGWNLKGKDGAVYAIPAELTEGLEGAVQLWYYTDKASNPLGEEDTLKAGSTYFVKAELLGDYKDNFVFENSEEGKPHVSDFETYKISKSGAAAALDTVKGFIMGTWLGLPIWAWLLIGIAVLILLIIIIAVACKRRKSKEEKAEIKARKEEERERREEERRLQQERLQAERELAKAKQEAELEKIRAQAGMGMASMSMQQAMPAPQMQQQPVQQQMSAQQPMQSVPADLSALAEIKAELAEIKARQSMGAGYSQPMPMQYAQPQSQYNNDPVAAAELIRLKAENEAHMRAELERARSEAERARMEAELARVRAESRYAYPAQQFEGNGLGGDMQKIGALAVAIWQSMNKAAEPAELKAPETPQIAEESASGSAMYPPDAIVTTTTTVDTTQKPLRRTERDSVNDFADVDGFYDAID